MKLFEKNVGGIDKYARMVAGIALIAAAYLDYFAAPYSYAAGLAGLILLATGVFGTCGLYSLLGISTAEKKK